ncbi:putative DNA repair protein Rad4, partial [Aspergillus bombycis]
LAESMPRTTRARSKKNPAPGGHQSREQDDEIPEVYQEMLAEAEARDPGRLENDRPIKKRKVQGQTLSSSAPSQITKQGDQYPSKKQENVNPQVQTVYDSSSDDESEMEWEEVDISQAPAAPIEPAPVPGGENDTMQITLDPHQDQKRKVIRRRKPITAAEKEIRLHVHKAHLLCLLSHAQLRNLWCNDEYIQGFLKQMLTKRVISLLNPSQEQPQYTRSTMFIDGLNQASDAFLKRFRVTKPGLKRAHWADDSLSLKQRVEDIQSDAEVFLSKEDFLKQAKTLQGSRDFGAQLFCALLRSAAVEARLICSLQPLPFTGTTKQMMPTKPGRQIIVISSDDHDTSTDDLTKRRASPTPSRTRRLGRPQFKPSTPPKSFIANSRPSIRESLHPVFWVEAFNEAMQKWVPVDPLVTKSLAKPSKFEPPSSDPYNCMSYVIAFEEDASARDVTRRYSKAFNAKTRKLRVESTKHGERWWSQVMRFYERPFLEDRDEVEISELTAKIAAEPMPRNIQDFKDHPIFALERHLRRHETIFPKRVVGQVSVSKSGSKNQVLEPVYRRSDIHVLRSANRWFRSGRDIKLGEQPLKRVQSHSNQAIAVEEDERDPEQNTETALYAFHQTELYTPPSVVQGKVPKNAFGNLDVYVPSMVPPGGVHIKHPDARHAAKLLGIDYTDAVTGFNFKGRHGTAVVQGVVIANEYGEALKEVLGCLEDQRLQAELEQKSAEALRLWKHFLLRLRIAKRVQSYAVEGEEADDEESIASSYTGHGNPEETGGGFIPEPNQEAIGSQSITQERHFESFTAPKNDDFLGGGFIPDDSETHQETAEDSAPEVAKGPSHTNRAEPSLYSLVVVSDDTNTAQSTKPYQGTTISPEASAPNSRDKEGPKEDDRKVSEGVLPNTLISTESSTAANTHSASVDVTSQPISAIQSRIESPVTSDKGSNSNDEGSLLSHDPEDEDAIPEWLMSD